MNKIAIFDVCWTLYRSNTTIDFIGYLLKRNNKFKYLVFVVLMWRPIALCLVRLAKIDLRKLAIRQLEGYTKESLADHAHRFYFSFLKKRENDVVYEKLLELKKENANVFLASASLDIVVATIASNINAKYVASQLQYVNGVCTGVLCSDITGKKYAALKKEALTGFYDVMYSDNAEDLAMAKHVGDYFQVVNSRVLKKTKILRFQGAE